MNDEHDGTGTDEIWITECKPGRISTFEGFYVL
jgi:hypothetical protein